VRRSFLRVMVTLLVAAAVWLAAVAVTIWLAR
jgi:hypothetical protein